jgi:drug/metabolite transporter (DMT)-like permease
MGISGAAGFLLMLIALTKLPGIVAFPVKNLGNLVLTGIVSILAWREKLSKTQWAGIILSLAAICLIY